LGNSDRSPKFPMWRLAIALAIRCNQPSFFDFNSVSIMPQKG